MFVWLAREKPTNSELIAGIHGLCREVPYSLQLHNRASIRSIETAAISGLEPHTLMQTAGMEVAALALACFPHASTYWIACGTGNNAGDGFTAARFLRQWGKNPVVTMLSNDRALPIDAEHALRLAIHAGVSVEENPPQSFDVCIDALYGIGKQKDFSPQCRDWIAAINHSGKPVLAVDVPTGLNSDTGAIDSLCVKADLTLSLLTLKPGLFTAKGRDVSGDIWFNHLGVAHEVAPCAEINHARPILPRLHDTHKGNFGDVGVIGGAKGMSGAALLAANAALHGGAGRIFLALLDKVIPNFARPELMCREVDQLPIEQLTVVAGCGGANDITLHLPAIIARSKKLVLDADALNAIARNPGLQQQLMSRSPETTALTPHPLEAARLLNTDTTTIQSDRLEYAQRLANQFQCTVVLKGSGTIIAAPGEIPRINATGDAKLATGGTGDVLAGLLGAYFTNAPSAFDASCAAVYRHGLVANQWAEGRTLTPLDLSERL